MVMTTKGNAPQFDESTKPVEMKRAVVAMGKPRRVGEIVEVNAKDFYALTVRGYAIPHLGEPVVKASKKRKAKRD